jgi:hypothetical protein
MESKTPSLVCVIFCQYPCLVLLSLIRTIGFAEGTSVDYRLPSPHLGNVGTRHAESVSALVIGHGMPCPYHSIVSFENRSLIRTLDRSHKGTLVKNSKIKLHFALLITYIVLPL